MRTLVLVLLVTVVLGGCAAKNSNSGAPQPSPQPVSAMDQVQMRACESCRHNLELCQGQHGGDVFQAGTKKAECMDDFMACMNAQQLDSARCQGMN